MSLSNLSVVQVTKVGKRELREKFLKAVAVGGREANKSSRDSLSSTVVTWTTLKSDEDQIFPKDAASIIVKTEYFFNRLSFWFSEKIKF